MKKLLLIFTTISLFASCTDNRSASVAEIVSYWEGRKILFPENSVFTIQGRDTVDFQFMNAPYKILTYVDSAGCMSCKLHLSLWNKIIEEVDSLSDDKVPILFYIHAPNRAELEIITFRESFTYPICYDDKDWLNNHNNFPTDMNLQTFLLDRNNKVIALGNPVNNPRIRSLYYKLITEGSLQEANLPITDITLDYIEIDLGEIDQKSHHEKRVVITNIGNAPLLIQEVFPSCDCMVVDYPEDTIPIGQSADIKIRYTAYEKGVFEKFVTIYCNIPSSSVDIWLTGKVK